METQKTPEAAELLKSHIAAIREAAGVDTVVIFTLKNGDSGGQICAEIQSPPLDHIHLAEALENTAKEIKLNIFAKVMSPEFADAFDMLKNMAKRNSGTMEA